MVHEARGLDINPRTLAKFQRQGDTESVRVLDIIHNDEITHVAAGQRWFSFILSEMKKLGMPFETNCMRGRDVVSASTSACSGVFVDADSSQYDDRYVLFHRIVRKHYFSKLKPPFNNEDRLKAGLDTDYYIPLS